MPRRRLGVVLLVPDPWAAEIDGLRRALGDGALGRIPAHLTLVPPVNVAEERMPEALDVLRGAAAEALPFTARLGPPATFLPVNPVIYLSVERVGSAEVHRLRDAVFSGPFERPLTWSFVPHVTLADDAEPDRIAAALRSLRDFTVDVDFDRVQVLEEGEGRAWHQVADAPLGPAVVVGRGGLEVVLAPSQRLDPEAAAWTERAWSAYTSEAYGHAAPDEPFAIVARRDGTVVGTATGQFQRDVAYLDRLVVDADERSTGVGSRLLAAIESMAADRGLPRLALFTRADGPARAFYEARGWVAAVDLPQWRAGHDFVLMERRLVR